jgi:hypothetical protein
VLPDAADAGTMGRVRRSGLVTSARVARLAVVATVLWGCSGGNRPLGGGDGGGSGTGGAGSGVLDAASDAAPDLAIDHQTDATGDGAPGALDATDAPDASDAPPFTVTPPNLSLPEGYTAWLDIYLTQKPAGRVTLAVTSSDPTRLTADPQALVFDPSNVLNPLRAKLSARYDPDVEPNQVSVVVAGSAGAATVAVTVSDHSAFVSLDLSPTQLDLYERARPRRSFMVWLTQPAGDVTVEISSSRPDKVAVSPAALRFTAAEFSAAQEVQVLALPDDDAQDERATITVSGGGEGVAALPARTVAVTVRESDEQSLVVTPRALQLTEQGSNLFYVQPAFAPAVTMVVNVLSSRPDKLLVEPAMLVFDPDNFETPRPVIIYSLDDADLDDELVTVTLISSAVPSSTVLPVAVTDDDR